MAGPTGVDCDEVDGIGQAAEMTGVGALHDDDTVIGAEAVVEHTEAAFDGVNLGGAVSEQAVDESSGVASEVGAATIAGRDIESLEGVIELGTGSRRVIVLWTGHRIARLGPGREEPASWP